MIVAFVKNGNWLETGTHVSRLSSHCLIIAFFTLIFGALTDLTGFEFIGFLVDYLVDQIRLNLCCDYFIMSLY